VLLELHNHNAAVNHRRLTQRQHTITTTITAKTLIKLNAPQHNNPIHVANRSNNNNQQPFSRTTVSALPSNKTPVANNNNNNPNKFILKHLPTITTTVRLLPQLNANNLHINQIHVVNHNSNNLNKFILKLQQWITIAKTSTKLNALQFKWILVVSKLNKLKLQFINNPQLTAKLIPQLSANNLLIKLIHAANNNKPTLKLQQWTIIAKTSTKPNVLHNNNLTHAAFSSNLQLLLQPITVSVHQFNKIHAANPNSNNLHQFINNPLQTVRLTLQLNANNQLIKQIHAANPNNNNLNKFIPKLQLTIITAKPSLKLNANNQHIKLIHVASNKLLNNTNQLQ
jgi:hypothetical protein